MGSRLQIVALVVRIVQGIVSIVTNHSLWVITGTAFVSIAVSLQGFSGSQILILATVIVFLFLAVFVGIKEANEEIATAGAADTSAFLRLEPYPSRSRMWVDELEDGTLLLSVQLETLVENSKRREALVRSIDFTAWRRDSKGDLVLSDGPLQLDADESLGAEVITKQGFPTLIGPDGWPALPGRHKLTFKMVARVRREALSIAARTQAVIRVRLDAMNQPEQFYDLAVESWPTAAGQESYLAAVRP